MNEIFLLPKHLIHWAQTRTDDDMSATRAIIMGRAQVWICGGTCVCNNYNDNHNDYPAKQPQSQANRIKWSGDVLYIEEP